MNKTSSNNHPVDRPRPVGRSRPQSPLGKDVGRETNRRAAAILEVLGGLRTPAEAAAALKISVTHYYILERKALQGLRAACEPRTKGPKPRPLEQQLAAAQRQLQRSEQECLRQAALVRATQRVVGLSPAPAKMAENKTRAKGKAGGKKTRRRPTVRALRAAQTLQKNSSGLDSAAEVEQPPVQVPPVAPPPNCSSQVKERQDGSQR